MPVEVLGLDSLPEVGDTLQVVTDTAKAKQIVMFREAKAREVAMAKTSRITLDTLHDQLQGRRDQGTQHHPQGRRGRHGGGAVATRLQKLSNDKVPIRVLHAGVGAINEDRRPAGFGLEAIIIGFNVRPERNAAALAEQRRWTSACTRSFTS